MSAIWPRFFLSSEDHLDQLIRTYMVKPTSDGRQAPGMHSLRHAGKRPSGEGYPSPGHLRYHRTSGHEFHRRGLQVDMETTGAPGLWGGESILAEPATGLSGKKWKTLSPSNGHNRIQIQHRAWHTKAFDSYLAAKYPDAATLSRRFLTGWCSRTMHESTQTIVYGPR